MLLWRNNQRLGGLMKRSFHPQIDFHVFNVIINIITTTTTIIIPLTAQ